MIQTEFQFELPIGYQDQDGNLHRRGTMRLATAADEILPLQDPRVRSNEAYLIIILLSRVITLEGVPHINPKVIEGLYAADLAYVQGLYNRINRNGKASEKAVCPKCAHEFEVEMNGLGGS
jgi:hypothetical protein